MLLVRIGKEFTPESKPETRLTEVLHAARKTDFYKCWLRSLDDDPDHTLDLLPHVDIAHFDEDPDQFRNPKRSKRLAADFVYPIQPAPRVLILVEGFRQTAHVRIARKFTSSARTGTIAAPVGVLRELARTGRSFDYPVVAFTGVRHGFLSDADRDLFWRTFGVPVFEQLTGIDNDVLAAECEAHEGLHIRASDAIFEFRGRELVVSSLSNFVHPVLRLALGLTARIEQSLCGCGKPGPRLMDIALYEKPHRAAAG